jgi:hypothetical protein
MAAIFYAAVMATSVSTPTSTPIPVPAHALTTDPHAAASDVLHPAHPPSAVRWYAQAQADEAIRAARDLQRPLFVDLFAIGCKGCEMLERTTYLDPRVAALLNDRFVPVLVNGWQQDEDRARLNGPAAFLFAPVLITRAPDGIELRRTNGYLPPDDMLVELRLGLGLAALHAGDAAAAWSWLDAAVREAGRAKNLPEALWWRGVAAFRRDGRSLSALEEAWRPLIAGHPDSPWADRANVLGPDCAC